MIYYWSDSAHQYDLSVKTHRGHVAKLQRDVDVHDVVLTLPDIMLLPVSTSSKRPIAVAGCVVIDKLTACKCPTGAEHFDIFLQTWLRPGDVDI